MTRVTQKVTSIIKVGGLKEEKEPFDFQFVFLGSSLSLEWQTTSCTSFPSLPYPEDFRSNAGHRSKSYINCLTSFNIDLLCMLSCFSCVQLFESRPQWTVAPPRGLFPTRLLCTWGFSRQEYWSGLPCLPPGDLSNPGIKPTSPALQEASLLLSHLGSPNIDLAWGQIPMINSLFYNKGPQPSGSNSWGWSEVELM